MQQLSPARCPNPECPYPVDVRKVTEVIATGTVEWHRSDLVEQLLHDKPTPPLPLQVPSPRGTVVRAIGIGVFIWFGVGFLPVLPLSLQGRLSPQQLATVVAVFGGVVVVAGMLFIFGHLAARRDRTRIQSLKLQADATNRQRQADYERALDNWSHKLYYCNRCGSRFVAGHPLYAPKEAMSRVLAQ